MKVKGLKGRFLALVLGLSVVILFAGCGDDDGAPASTCVDNDGDGYGEYCSMGADCDDSDANINPQATETTCDGEDNDCDAATLDAPDGDTDTWDVCGAEDEVNPDDKDPADCDDSDANINPGAAEIYYNGADDDCDPVNTIDNDQDGDGSTASAPVGSTPDCDDTNAGINPGEAETCDNCIDENCNYLIDEDCGGLTVIEVELNDDIATANGPFTLDVTVTGTVDPTGGDYDYFMINVCPGQQIGFDCDAEEYGSPLDSYLELYDSVGGFLTWNDDGTDPDTGYGGWDSYLSYQFSGPGTIYYLVVGDWSDNGGPGYWYDLLIRQECPFPDGDGDGITVCDGDCDDTDYSMFPGAFESCDGKDNDCNNLVDDNCTPEVFSEGFELGVGSWTTTLYAGEIDDLWHITGRDSLGPNSSMWCGIEASGDYATGNRINTAVISPAINLIGPTTAFLYFWESYDTEIDYDYCMVDISTDGGATWTDLRGIWGSAPSESSGGWVNTLIDISAYVGNTVNIRFYFYSDGSITDLGWFVDDVAVYAN